MLRYTIEEKKTGGRTHRAPDTPLFDTREEAKSYLDKRSARVKKFWSVGTAFVTVRR